MRKFMVVLMTMTLLSAVCNAVDSAGQAAGKAAVPSKLGIIYWSDAGGLTELERTTGEVKSKGGAGAFLTGFASAGLYQKKIKMVFIVPGSHSPIKMPQGRPEFLMKVTPGYDVKKIELIGFESKKKDRQLLAAEAGGFLGGSVSEGGYPIVPLDIESHKADPLVLVLRPAIDMKPGEYGFNYKDSNEVFCFGIEGETGETLSHKQTDRNSTPAPSIVDHPE